MATVALMGWRETAPGTAAALLRSAQEGDEAAFAELVALTERPVLRLAARVLDDREDARDAAQEVFVRLHRHLHRLDPGRDPMPWLYRVTVNLCRTALRARRRQPLFVELAQETPGRTPVQAPSQERGLSAQDARRLLARALSSLSVKERIVVVLRELEGLDTEAIAGVMGCRRGTVRTHLCRGRMKLRRALEGGVR